MNIKCKKQLKQVEQLYENNFKEGGMQPSSLGWRDEVSQTLRFDKLSYCVEGDDQAAEVNDLGCGYASMFAYLDNYPGFKLSKFYGYDFSEKMLEAARDAVKDQRAEFFSDPFLKTEADYSFVSGSFNVKFDAKDSKWNEYIKDAILNMARMSRRGFAFNVLSSYVDWKEEHLYYADPLEFFDFCKKYVSRKVTLLHDYPLYEWTMVVKK